MIKHYPLSASLYRFGTNLVPLKFFERYFFFYLQEEELIESDELTVTETSVQGEVQGHDDTQMSMLVMSEDELIKSEPVEWTRDEDKLILQVLKQYLTPQERSDKTILEIIKDKNLSKIIMSGLPHKPPEDVSERVLYLLQILILSDYDKGD